MYFVHINIYYLLVTSVYYWCVCPCASWQICSQRNEHNPGRICGPFVVVFLQTPPAKMDTAWRGHNQQKLWPTCSMCHSEPGYLQVITNYRSRAKQSNFSIQLSQILGVQVTYSPILTWSATLSMASADMCVETMAQRDSCGCSGAVKTFNIFHMQTAPTVVQRLWRFLG